MKRGLAILLLAGFLCLLGIAVMGESIIKVTVNGTPVISDQSPVIINGRTLVPLRGIFEALDIDPVWDGKTSTVTAGDKNVSLKLVIGSKSALVNNQVVQLDEPAIIIQGRTLVPARFIAETFGATVTWDAKTSTVVINTGEKPVAAKTGPFKGMLAPDFTLKDIEGKEWKLSSLKGNSVAVIFFTSW